MTYEEAIKVLDNTKVMILKGSGTDLAKASYMAVEALKKQIPKKVIREEGEIFDCDKEGNELRLTFNFCPSCKIRFIRYGMKHCGECGQAIDWSE